MVRPQPRTQALHCFYRDQWRLINAKRARVLGQHAKKPSAQARTLARLALIIATDLYKSKGAPGYEAGAAPKKEPGYEVDGATFVYKDAILHVSTVGGVY